MPYISEILQGGYRENGVAYVSLASLNEELFESNAIPLYKIHSHPAHSTILNSDADRVSWLKTPTSYPVILGYNLTDFMLPNLPQYITLIPQLDEESNLFAADVAVLTQTGTINKEALFQVSGGSSGKAKASRLLSILGLNEQEKDNGFEYRQFSILFDEDGGIEDAEDLYKYLLQTMPQHLSYEEVDL